LFDHTSKNRLPVHRRLAGCRIYKLEVQKTPPNWTALSP
jgi:hypothetical protein